MLCAIAYYSGDLQQAIRLAEWMKKLGPYRGHALLVARDISADLKPFADVGFDSVQEIVIRDDVWKKWAESPNNAFRKVAKHIQYVMPEPWLWLEPDVAPIRAGWLDAIQAEYRAKGKPFMGDFVPGVGGSPDHCSGIAVYPGMLTDYAGSATMAMEYPWDLEAADEIRPHAHFTELIKHNWRPPEFNSREEMQAEIPPECVLYHKDKTGALLRLLNGTDDAVTAAARINPCLDRIDGKLPDDAVTSPETLALTSMLRASVEVEEKDAARLLAADRIGELLKAQIPLMVSAVKLKDPEPFKATWVQQIEPWASPLESEQEIKRLCAELRRFCVGPVRTGIVRRELAVAKVTPPISGKKRRRK